MKKILLSLLTLAALAPLAQAQLHDATADFSITNGNANGVWSYGFSTTLGGALTLFDVTDGFISWKHSTVQSLGTPTVGRNDTGSVVNGIPVGSLVLHPGPAEYAVLRFTAPTTGAYNLLSQCLVGDFGETEMFVLRNSNAASPLFHSTTTSGNPLFTTGLTLTVGETVELVVGQAGDSFFFDSTPATFTLSGSTSAPEPGTGALIAVGGLLGLGYRSRSARRQKNGGRS